AVILDAPTGQVLAIATCRSFDPNAAGEADPDNLGNGAISGVLESGSVAKAITLSAAVQEGIVTPGDVRLTPDSITVGNTTVRDAHPHDAINYTVTGILAKSSNVGTIGIARELGNELLEQYLRAFGVGEQTGIELPGESPGILVPHEEWSIAQSINIPIGQGFALTTLQMASIYQTIANGGVRIPPRIVASTTSPDGTVTDTVQPQGVRVISEETAATMAYMLEAVVGEGGTALNASIGGYRVAGKTGTAQRPNPACSCYAGGGFWTTFAGFAPADAPEYVMSVMLQRPDSGVPAGPVFKNVMTFVLAHEAVAPTGAARPEFILIV
ncbi:MAG: penicillin-binding protein 2, partial [Actinomycetota bacterium]|nr:penicillin-binding protein 2 [Actinomycetota bacterium]